MSVRSDTGMEFTEEQLQRYNRHIMLPEVGLEGQKKIAQTKVFIVGAGGLGSPVGYYLTAAGVGTLAIIDNDKNLKYTVYTEQYSNAKSFIDALFTLKKEQLGESALKLNW